MTVKRPPGRLLVYATEQASGEVITLHLFIHYGTVAVVV